MSIYPAKYKVSIENGIITIVLGDTLKSVRLLFLAESQKKKQITILMKTGGARRRVNIFVGC